MVDITLMLSDLLGDPFRYEPGEQTLSDFLQKKFSEVCDRNNTTLEYNTFVGKYKAAASMEGNIIKLVSPTTW